MRVRRGILLLLLLAVPAVAQTRTKNVVLIVTDGMRWQEIFRGADPSLINDKSDFAAEVRKQFVRATPEESRAALMPFLWGTVARQGTLLGDRDHQSFASVTNGLKFSYPGYNEMITGHADPRINSNKYGPNPNRSVFEWLDSTREFRGKVAEFGTWDTFDDIFNRKRSTVFERNGWETPFTPAKNAVEGTINDLYDTTTRLWSYMPYDSFLQQVVKEYVRTRHPRVLFIGYGETDEWAHDGNYEQMLLSAHRVDAFVADLWNTMQAMPQYRGTTTLLITTDHGRGSTAKDWTDHGEKVEGAENIWLAAIGPDVPPSGDFVPTAPAHQAQIAATIARWLGRDYAKAEPNAAPPLAPLAKN